MKLKNFSRRAFLRGAGVSIALPYLESLSPWLNLAHAQAGAPPRFIVLYKPNGDHPQNWGTNFSGVLAPLSPWKSEVTVIRGLNNLGARGYPDGHAPMISAFLTGGPFNHSTSDIRAPKSIDQIIADARGEVSLTPAGPFTFPTTNGFNSEYFSSLSWVGPRAATKLTRPSVIFDRIFKDASTPTQPGQEQIQRVYKKSILDYAKDDATRKMASLGSTDKAKLDEYLTGVRELEVRIGELEPQIQQCTADMARPSDNNIFVQHTKIMLDLIVKALECGNTSVAAYMMDCEVGNGYDNHHQYSHYNENSTYRDKLSSVNSWYMSQLAYFIQKLDGVKEANDSSLLDNSMIIYGSGLGDSHNHSPNDLRIVVAGRAKGLLNPSGKELSKSNVPLSNLLLTALQKMGVNRSSFAQSNGVLNDI